MTDKFQWFDNARFGLFLHWGIYSLGASSEWQMSHEQMTVSQYRKYFEFFQPDLFNPGDWARLAKAAGMKYFVITAKHHDGFCLWDTKYTDFNAVKAPRCGYDLLRKILEAFRTEGLRVGVYYSLSDWNHPDFPITGKHPLRNHSVERNHIHYTEFLFHQVRELLTDYGKIDLLWFDGSYPETEKVWNAPALNQMIRSLQPEILVNRLPGFSDFDSPEQNIPKNGIRNSTGKPLRWEGCQVFNGQWGYVRYDRQARKNTREVLEMLVRHVSRDGNLLLNAGPTSRGCFDSFTIAMLSEMAEWIRCNGRSIEGCTGAPQDFPEPEACRYTFNPKKNTLYLHLFSWPDRRIHLANLGGKTAFAQLLFDGSEIPLTEFDPQNVHGAKTLPGELLLNLPVISPPTPLPVIELFLK